MAKSLLIVESPAKAKTIEKYLGKGFQVKASFGHVRDLPKSKLGIDIDAGFNPQYVVPKKAQKTVTALRKATAGAQKVYLATDLDREGEAIAWHIVKATGLDPDSEKVERITFSEITKDAIVDALKNSRKINEDLVDAQQARRVLDRLVGYKLSPLLWSKIRKGLSAGRVQSVALKLIIDREREIQAFNPEEYWTIDAILAKLKSKFKAGVIAKGSEKLTISNEVQAKQVLSELDGANYVVKSVKKKQVKRNPVAPFITSTLQQDAGRKLRFSAKKTMVLAQQLYEGIELGAEGSIGLITYMRTDSTTISAQALTALRSLIENKYGKEYLPEKPRFYKKAKAAQEAHEAIRPTYVNKEPAQLAKFLSKDQLKLYELIWKRAVASQMESARVEQVSVDIAASDYILRATGSTILFPGYLKVYEESKEAEDANGDSKANILPELSEGDKLKLVSIDPNQHFTQPPPRYSEATLIKTLEELGIGRPSTYAPTLSTLKEREYIEITDRKLVPQDIGFVVNDMLVAHFANIVNTSFTAKMENELDQVADGDIAWQKVVGHFWDPFSKQLEETSDKIEKVKLPEKTTGEVCPECGKELVYKRSRFGEFIACSGWPECKYKPEQKRAAKTLGIKCPEKECEGEIIEKRTKRGKIFYGCSEWSKTKCGFASWDKPVEQPCPQCGGLMVEKRDKNKCTKCDYSSETG
jgi:DNA topoisomerase-1